MKVSKLESAHALLKAARRYAKTEVARAIGAAFTVIAVVILAALAWFWVFK